MPAFLCVGCTQSLPSREYSREQRRKKKSSTVEKLENRSSARCSGSTSAVINYFDSMYSFLLIEVQLIYNMVFQMYNKMFQLCVFSDPFPLWDIVPVL